MPVTTQEDDWSRDAPAMMGIRSPDDLILLRHIMSRKRLPVHFLQPRCLITRLEVAPE